MASSKKSRNENKLLIKKSFSLKFDEIDYDKEKTELKKNKERSSLDNLSNNLDELNESNSCPGYSFKQSKNNPTSKSPFKIFEDKQLKSNTIEIQCDLEDEFTLKDSDLTEEELEIKANNPNNYWKLIAEKLRVELYDCLQENLEVSNLNVFLNKNNNF
jgi:hypothetical protein